MSHIASYKDILSGYKIFISPAIVATDKILLNFLKKGLIPYHVLVRFKGQRVELTESEAGDALPFQYHHECNVLISIGTLCEDKQGFAKKIKPKGARILVTCMSID